MRYYDFTHGGAISADAFESAWSRLEENDPDTAYQRPSSTGRGCGVRVLAAVWWFVVGALVVAALKWAITRLFGI